MPYSMDPTVPVLALPSLGRALTPSSAHVELGALARKLQRAMKALVPV